MTERDQARLIVWSEELKRVHQRLRDVLQVAREAVNDGANGDVKARDLLLFCHGFCAALAGHHEGEDRALFPAVAARHPELAETLRKLRQDHSMIAHLLAGLQAAVDQAEPPAELDRHLEGVAAIMESHFRFEERSLLTVLATLDLAADPREVMGPL